MPSLINALTVLFCCILLVLPSSSLRLSKDAKKDMTGLSKPNFKRNNRWTIPLKMVRHPPRPPLLHRRRRRPKIHRSAPTRSPCIVVFFAPLSSRRTKSARMTPYDTRLQTMTRRGRINSRCRKAVRQRRSASCRSSLPTRLKPKYSVDRAHRVVALAYRGALTSLVKRFVKWSKRTINTIPTQESRAFAYRMIFTLVATRRRRLQQWPT